MKNFLLPFFVLLLQSGYAQKINFNPELEQFCKNSINEFSSITEDRKLVLDNIAKQLTKKKYVLFTCETNSRRTVLLQAWAQTAFYYHDLRDKIAFSIGDTVTDIHPEIAIVLKEAGFSSIELENAPAKGYIISVNRGYESILVSKKELGTIDTAKVVVVSICYTGEKSLIANTISHISLPYQSPRDYDNTAQQKQKYSETNKKISIEMLYLADRIRKFIAESSGTTK